MTRLLPCLLVTALAAACGDDSSSDARDTTPSDTTPADTTPSDTTPADTTPADTTPADTTPSDTTPSDTTPSDTTPTDTTPADTTPTEPTRVEERCDEGGYTDCFVNDDCPAAEHCQNMSATDVEIPCCIAGPRGTKITGEPCTTENDCATALCISYNEGPSLCSELCTDPAECPAEADACEFGFCVPSE